MQVIYATIDGNLTKLELPNPDEVVLPGLTWGAFDELLTPAYWRGQAWQHELLGTYENQKLGRNLKEEIAACLLGGFGMKAELGLAAYQRLRDRKLIENWSTAESLEHALAEPFYIANRLCHYRFPRQKAQYLSKCMEIIDTISEPTEDIALRNLLVHLPGIGPKTASWIVRNYRSSNEVAIIDVHILRACRHIRLFDYSFEPQRHYEVLERAFLQFSDALGVAASMLDALIWDYMRKLGGNHHFQTKIELTHASMKLRGACSLN